MNLIELKKGDLMAESTELACWMKRTADGLSGRCAPEEVQGYMLAYYFDAQMRYLGDDADGIYPLFISI